MTVAIIILKIGEIVLGIDKKLEYIYSPSFRKHLF